MWIKNIHPMILHSLFQIARDHLQIIGLQRFRNGLFSDKDQVCCDIWDWSTSICTFFIMTLIILFSILFDKLFAQKLWHLPSRLKKTSSFFLLVTISYHPHPLSTPISLDSVFRVPVHQPLHQFFPVLRAD